MVIKVKELKDELAKKVSKQSKVFSTMSQAVIHGHSRLEQLYDRKKVSLLEVTEFKLESDLGKCPKCQKPWTPRIVDNIFVTFTYFEPDCRCYPVCPFCGKLLIRESEEKAEYCSNCKYMPPCGIKIKLKAKAKGGEEGEKPGRCKGRYILLPGGSYMCNECSAIKSFIIRDDVIVPRVYRGGTE